MAASASENSTRIPAWKRVGLKLKEPGSPKRNRDEPAVVTEQPLLKKLKAESRQSTLSIHSTGTRILPKSSYGSPDSTKPTKAKKSVAFSKDTKPEDGNTPQLLLKDWQSRQNGGEGEFTSEEAQQFQVSSVHAANLDPSQPMRLKSPKKDKSKKRDQAVINDLDGERLKPPYLIYLDTFIHDRAHWKFNKVRQIQLLKFVFDTEKIPPRYDTALFEYLEGLQGEEARKQLVTSANNILSAPEEDHGDEEDSKMDDPAIRKQARDTALNSYLIYAKTVIRHIAEQHEVAAAQQLLDAAEDLRTAIEDSSVDVLKKQSSDSIHPRVKSAYYRLQRVSRAKRAEGILRAMGQLDDDTFEGLKRTAAEAEAEEERKNQIKKETLAKGLKIRIHQESLVDGTKTRNRKGSKHEIDEDSKPAKPARKRRLRVGKLRTGVPEDDYSDVSDADERLLAVS